MKTLLLSLLLLASAAQADQWQVNGRTYNGTMHKFNADQTMVWVTSDWDNYGGSWIKVAELDSATRVRLNVATPQERALVQAAAEQRRQFEAQAAAQAQARAAAERTARIEEQQLAIQRQQLELERRQLALQQQQQQQQQQQHPFVTNNTYIVPSPQGTYYRGYSQSVHHHGVHHHGAYPQGTYPQSAYPQVPRVPQVPYVPRVPAVPYVPQVPQVAQPIVLWYN
jgi:hypothetical protein